MVYRIPAVNLVGRGCLAQLKDEIGTLGCKKALVVSDKFLTENGVVEKVTKVLDQVGIEHTLYNDVKQNPSVANVEGGLEVLKKENCDFITSIPMKGDIDSLNASVAAGVLAYEIVRQRLAK